MWWLGFDYFGWWVCLIGGRISILLFTVLSLLLVSLTLYFLSLLFRVDIPSEMLKFNLSLLAFSYAIFMTSMIVGGLRFYFLSRSAGGRLDLSEAILARFGGMFIAFITPFYAGGEPIRIYALKKNGLSWGRSFEVIVLEVIFDVYVHNILTILLFVLSDISKVETIPILAIATGSVIFWSIPTATLLLGVGRVLNIFEKLGMFKIKMLSNLIEAAKSFEGETLLKRRRVVLGCIGLTLASTILSTISFYISALSVGIRVDMLESLKTFVYSMSMSSIPTPGGAGGIEYALLTQLPLRGVIAWRMVSYYLALPLFSTCLLWFLGRKLLDLNKF